MDHVMKGDFQMALSTAKGKKYNLMVQLQRAPGIMGK
jgi:hypothetical protein